MEEPVLKTPTINIELPTPKESIKEEPKQEENNPVANPTLNTNFGSSININNNVSTNEETFDPVNLIDTLDPDYEEKQDEKLGIDLKTAINTVRDMKDSLQEKGFNISLEETDLNDLYQFVIKIKKD